MPRLTAPLPALLVAIVAMTAQAGDSPKRIAFTFDDAPRSAGALMSAQERTTLFIDSLAKAGVEGAMFFVTTRNLEKRGEEGERRLRQYVEAGHTLANHTHAHTSVNRMSSVDFLKDVAEAQRRLAAFPGNTPYFRFPYLDEGDTAAKRDAVRAGLEQMGLIQGYVTVDNYDWYLQALFDEAIRAGLPMDLEAWKSLYVEVLVSAVRHYDAMAVESLGRSPAHLLLLHENDLAALFIDEFAAAIRSEGWEIIPAVEAYEDPLARMEPDTMRLSQGRVAAHASIRGVSRERLRHPLESQSELRSLAVARGLAGLAQGAYLGMRPPGLKPEIFAPGIVTLPDRYEFGFNVSPDGREVFFGVSTDGRGDIRTTRYVDGEWTAPQIVLSHPNHSFADPFRSRDGTRLYFISTRPTVAGDPPGQHDLWYIERRRDGWSSEPVSLGTPVNTAFNEYYVTFADDGTLAFASNKHDGGGSNFDVYLSRRTESGYEEPQRLTGKALTRAYEADPFIAPDGSYILFSSTRRSGEGRADIYVSFRLHDRTWSRAINLGRGVNTAAKEFTPSVSRDGRYLFYSSDEDIYWVDAGVIDVARQRLPAD